jgi:hypothetical protein
MLDQIIGAGALKLPYRLADDVKPRRLGNFVVEAVMLHFVFNFIALDRFIAQRAELTGAVTGPHPFE